MASPSTSPPSAPPDADADAEPTRLAPSVIATAVVGAVATLVAPFVGDVRTALSVAAGAVAAVLNLLALGALVKKLVPARDADGQAPASSPVWIALLLAKLVALFGGALLAMHLGWVRPVPLVVGYLALPVGLVVAALRDRPQGPPGPPGPPPG